MKKIILLTLVIPLLFNSCEKEDDTPEETNSSSNIENIIIDKIWEGRVPEYNGWGDDIIFQLNSNDSLYIFTSGYTNLATSIGTWNLTGKVITYDQVNGSIEYLNQPFGELTEYSATQLKFKIDSNINAICEIYNLNSQNCTYIPDINFEQYLIYQGLDNVVDNYVLTSNINTITYLDLQFRDIYDLTGIEGFTNLTYLNCSYNQLTSLNLNFNPILNEIYCNNNNLYSLDIKNENNTNIGYFNIINNPNLNCINVDNANWSINNWFNIDSQHYFSENCQ